MKKSIITLILTLCIMMTCSFAVSASSVTVNALYDVSENKITVFGTAEGAIMVTIIPFEDEIANLSEENVPVYMGQFDADDDYNFDIKWLYAVPSGKYTVYVSCDGEYAQDSFMYFNADTANSIIEEMNKKDSLSEYMEAADKKELGIDESDEKYLENQDKIFTALYKLKPEDIEAFAEAYNKIYVLSSIEGAEKDEIMMLLEKYQSVLKIDYNKIIKNDERISEKILDEFTKILSEIDYLSEYDNNGEIDVENIIENAKALSAVRSAESWAELKQNVSVDFKEYFEEMLSYKKYKSISNKNKVYREMFDTDFDSIDEVREEFEDICDSVYKSENRSSSSSGGSSSSSGGGFSSGGGVSVSVPVAKPDTDIVPGDSATENMGIFSDVKSGDWYYKAVSTLKEKEIISGYEDGTFKPSKSVTRAEFIKMVISNIEDNQNDVTTFSDVSEGDWYYTYIMKARRLGIAEGSENKFRPNDNISRQDAVLILYRVLTLSGNQPEGFRPFADWEEISSYASEAVLSMGCAEFVNGNDMNMFLPHNALTRAEAAQMIYNVSGLQ